MLIQGNAVHIPLVDGSVHCCVTSPPYFGLRDYGVVGQIGLEPTVDEYVAAIVAVFQEVWRVLRDDGTCWVVLGDSYAGYHGNSKVQDNEAPSNKPGYIENMRKSTVNINNSKFRPGSGRADGVVDERGQRNRNGVPCPVGLKSKDLIGIPWRVAFALQADGWYLRSEITYVKSAPMPESVTDRPTSATEKIFLLSKNARYFYDNEAVKEPSTGQTGAAANFKRNTKDHVIPNQSAAQHRADRKPTDDTGTHNMRNYLILGPSPYKGAHFAVYPERIPEIAILAGTSAVGCCAVCSAPWVRVIERTAMVIARSKRTHALGRTRSSGIMLEPPRCKTVGWQPTCNHNAPAVPSIVLDPFIGSGTTGAVATRLGRQFIGLDLSMDYLHLARKRVLGEQLPLIPPGME